MPNDPANTSAALTRAKNAARPHRARYLWLALACGLALSFALDGAVMAVLKPLRDTELAHLLRHSIRWLGVGYIQALALLLLISIGAILGHRAKSAGTWALLAFALAGATAAILKVVIHRPRPWVELPPPAAWMGYAHLHEYQSFPSGESTTSFAIAVALGAWFPWLRLPLVVVAVAVAAARVVVGNHFPSDAWAGAMLGIAAGQWVTRLAAARSRQGEVADA